MNGWRVIEERFDRSDCHKMGEDERQTGRLRPKLKAAFANEHISSWGHVGLPSPFALLPGRRLDGILRSIHTASYTAISYTNIRIAAINKRFLYLYECISHTSNSISRHPPHFRHFSWSVEGHHSGFHGLVKFPHIYFKQKAVLARNNLTP